MKIIALSDFCVDIFPQSGRILPGGNALNVAVNCKQAGGDAFVMGNIGKDEHGKILKNAIDKCGLNREKVYEVDGATAKQIIHIDENGDRYFKDGSWDGGVFDKFRISGSDKEFLNTMDVVSTTIGEPDFENIIFSFGSKGRPLVSVDFHDGKLKPEYEKYFPQIDMFVISGKSQDSREFRSVLKAWSEKYDTVFIATFGENGSIAFKGGKLFACEAEKVKEAADTTGCGDSYRAGFIMEYFKSGDIERSMKKGSRAAAVTLSHMGGFKI